MADEPKIYRVRVDRVSAVRHPEHDGYVVPDPRQPYTDEDPLVRAFPWMFASEDEIAELSSAEPIASVPIETATARPGERRNVRAPRK